MQCGCTQVQAHISISNCYRGFRNTRCKNASHLQMQVVLVVVMLAVVMLVMVVRVVVLYVYASHAYMLHVLHTCMHSHAYLCIFNVYVSVRLCMCMHLLHIHSHVQTCALHTCMYYAAFFSSHI